MGPLDCINEYYAQVCIVSPLKTNTNNCPLAHTIKNEYTNERLGRGQQIRTGRVHSEPWLRPVVVDAPLHQVVVQFKSFGRRGAVPVFLSADRFIRLQNQLHLNGRNIVSVCVFASRCQLCVFVPRSSWSNHRKRDQYFWGAESEL